MNGRLNGRLSGGMRGQGDGRGNGRGDDRRGSDPVPEDGGRQFERTSLAWLRTALATTGVAVLIVRSADEGAERWIVLAICATGLAIALGAAAARTSDLRLRRAAATPNRWVTAGFTAAILLMQTAGLFLAL